MSLQPGEKKQPLSNQSTEKALAILELLAQSSEPVRLRDLSRTLSINASTALRFLTTLQNCGYVEQEADTQRYYLTYKICRLANQVSSHTQLQSITHPYLQRLSEQFEEVLCVSVERDMTMVYVDVASGPEQTLMSLQRVGNTSPMHCTGNGKLLLLNYTPEQLDEMIRRKGAAPIHPKHHRHPGGAGSGAGAHPQRGLAYDNEECEMGVRCLACPIYDHTGKVMAGMSVTGPASRMTDEKLQRIRGRLSEAAKKISEVFGYSPEHFNK